MAAYSKLIAAILAVLIGQLLLRYGIDLGKLGVAAEGRALLEMVVQAALAGIAVWAAPRNRYKDDSP